MGGGAGFSINNDNLSDRGGADSSDKLDPENLLPLTHFSNTQGGLGNSV